jgi:Tol biopolymer transport system component
MMPSASAPESALRYGRSEVNDSAAVYADPGFLLFQRQGVLVAQPFNPSTFEISGDPIRIADDVFVNSDGRAGVTVSHAGMLAYRSQVGGANQQFVWYDRNGQSLGSIGSPNAYNQGFDLSPDGRQVAVSILDPAIGASKLWVMDWARGVTTPLTFAPSGRDLVWSPDGRQILYSRPRNNSTTNDIVEKNASGVGEERVLMAPPGMKYVEDWSADGRYIVYCAVTDVPGQTDIWALPSNGEGEAFPVVVSPFGKDEPHFSYDSKWLAYSSLESRTWQVFVISFPDGNEKRQISDTGGSQPRWNRDGTELYYLGLDGRMMAATIRTSPRLDSDAPRRLFDTRLTVAPTLDQYDVTPDGQRFLILGSRSSTDLERPAVNVLVNWTRLLTK